MIKAILFDLDGTLANTDPLHFRVWKEVLHDHGLNIDQQFYKTYFSGRLNPDIIRELLPHLSLDEGQRLSEYKEASFRQRAAELLPLPGLLDLMTWGRHQGLKQAVVTNAPRPNAEFMLNALNLRHAFDLVVLAEELPKGKPDPLPYRYALEQLGITSKEAITFEDSPSGLRSSIAAEIPTVGVATTHPAQTLYDLGAHLVIEDFTDPALTALLTSLVETEQIEPTPIA